MSLYSSASDFAKDTWLDIYTNQLSQSEGSLLQLLGLSTDSRVKIEGRKAYMKIQVGDDLGFGVTSQGGDFPTPGDIASDEATLELMRFADTIQFDSHEMALLDSLDAAAAPIMAKKMDASRARVLRELERMSIMDGSGKLAKVASEAGSTITLDVAGSEYSERNPFTWIDDPNRSYYGVIDPTDGTWQTTAADYGYVTSTAEASNTITLSIDTGGAAAGDYVVTYYPGTDAYSTGGSYVSPEMDGLLALIDDSNTYLGIVRGSVQQWQSTVLDNSGTLRDISENLVHQLVNKVGRRSTKGMIVPSEYCAIADPGVWTAYHDLMAPGIRYTLSDRPDIGWGGRESLLMDGIPLYKHFQAPRHQILMVHKDSVGFVGPKHDTSSIVKFIERGGSIFFQANASSGQGYADKVYAMIAGWLGMYSDRPRNHGRLDDLNLTAPAYAGQ